MNKPVQERCGKVNWPRSTLGLLGRKTTTETKLFLKTNSNTVANSAYLDEMARNWIYTVCYSVIDFCLKQLFAIMDMLEMEESNSETEGRKGQI